MKTRLFNKKICVSYSILYGFSKSSLDSYVSSELDKEDGDYYRLSVFLLTNIGNILRNTKLTKKQTKKVVEYTKDVVEVEINKLSDMHDARTSPQILMILCLDYVLNIMQNKKIKEVFINYDISNLIDNIYKIKKYQKYIKSHSDFIEKVLK